MQIVAKKTHVFNICIARIYRKYLKTASTLIDTFLLELIIYISDYVIATIDYLPIVLYTVARKIKNASIPFPYA